MDLIQPIISDGVASNIVFLTIKNVPNNPNYFLITTKNFHNYEFQLIDGNTFSLNVIRCYYRYGFYEPVGEIIVEQWFFAMAYALPSNLMIDYSKFNKQILMVYSREQNLKKLELINLFNLIFFLVEIITNPPKMKIMIIDIYWQDFQYIPIPLFDLFQI